MENLPVPNCQSVEQLWAVEDQLADTQEVIVFIPFHAVHHDKPLAATPCPIRHALAVRAEDRTFSPTRVLFLPSYVVHYHKYLFATPYPMSHSLAVRTEDEIANPFLFHSVHDDQPLAATLYLISYSLAV